MSSADAPVVPTRLAATAPNSSSAPFSSTLRVGIAGAATPETRVEVEQSGHRRPVQISTAQHDGWREGFVQVYRNPFSLVITNAPPGGLQISAPMMLGRYDRPVLALLEGSWAILAMGLALWLWGTWRALRTEV